MLIGFQPFSDTSLKNCDLLRLSVVCSVQSYRIAKVYKSLK